MSRMLWSGQDADRFHDSVKYLAIIAAIIGGLLFYVLVIGFRETVTYRGSTPLAGGVSLTTDPPGRYFMANSLNPQRLRVGCQYRLSYRPAELGKALTRGNHSRIVKSATLVACP